MADERRLHLPAELARFEPAPESEPFWDACRRRELRVQRCLDCGRFRHPPIGGCPGCGSRRTEWRATSGRGTVYSYTIVRHAVVPALAAYVPYTVVVVELDDAPGAHLISNLVDGAAADLAPVIGAAVEVSWEDAGEGIVLPRFRRLAA